jgi:hypothetical protein
MSKRLRCPKCRARASELYSPDWVCRACLDPEVVKQYPAMKKKEQLKELRKRL